MAKRVQSPSSINTYKQCPRKYYYHYIEKLETLSNIHLIRGSIAHKVLEDFYDTNLEGVTFDNYKERLRKKMQEQLMLHWNINKKKIKELELSEEQESFYFEETMLMVLNWLDHLIKRLEDCKDGEMSFEEAFKKAIPKREAAYMSDVYKVRGYVDAIEEIEDEVKIIDYKTSSRLQISDEYRLQLAIYSLLYFEKHGKKPNKAGVFFLRHKPKFIKVDDELLEMAKEEIELIHERTESEAIEDYPQKKSGLCKWSTGQCDFYELCFGDKNNSEQ